MVKINSFKPAIICFFLIMFQMYWIAPVWFWTNTDHLQYEPPKTEQMPQSNRQEASQVPTTNTHDVQKEVFLELLVKNLKRKNSKNSRKLWSDEEDEILLRERALGKQWDQIAEKIEEGTAQNCCRRYARISKFLLKWPKQVDNEIIRLFQLQKIKWSEINQRIEGNFLGHLGYSEKQLKQRYYNYLRPGIQKARWSIEQDLKLIDLVNQNGNKWKKIMKQFPNRSELQVKNRYCRTIMPSMEKVRKLIKRKPRLWRNRN